MLSNEKILITGATGKIAFPIARELAKHNEVWGAARFSKLGDQDKLTAVGIHPFSSIYPVVISRPCRMTSLTCSMPL
jgi:nucleoside-diphosphate-sugar epimerase